MATRSTSSRTPGAGTSRAGTTDAAAARPGSTGAGTKRLRPITADDLWQLERIDAPSLSPDGAQVVVAVNRYSMEANRGSGALWLLSTLGGAPRQLTRCGEKDGHPAFSPQGDQIAFTAKRSHLAGSGSGSGGNADDTAARQDEQPQLYLIAPDGGEAWCPAELATGVDAFRWCPDGRHLVLLSWVFPGGAQAQAKALKAQQARKTSGIATSEGLYRWWDRMLPDGRSPHLLLLDTQRGTLRDLFDGHGVELRRTDPDATCFDISPDGRRVVFSFDPAQVKRVDGRCALAEIDLKTRRLEMLAQDLAWDYSAPRYCPHSGPDGSRVACIASHQALRHTAPGQLAVVSRGEPLEVLSAEWDHDVQAPLLWEDDAGAVLLAAEQQGRRHVWRFDLADRRAEVAYAGGWVQSFDKAAGVLVTLADAADHPGRLHATLPGGQARRIESFNDARMAGLALGRHEAITVNGAQGDAVQVWLHYPPDFDAGGKGKKKYPLLQVIHGGPHTAFGDQWHYRWNLKAFAAQGYVVAAVNYHGSSGFGQAFLDSNTGRWGELELADVEAATDLLLQQPWADAKRVFAAGGSYGGYMVAWMNGKLRAGRYAAYVCHAGCYDWVAMFADDCAPWHAKDLGAFYWDDPARVAAQNPLAHAAQMATPTLVVHGALDYRVPDAQGLAYYNTLKTRGIPARLLWFPDETHWVLKPRNSRQWYAEFFAWLAQHDSAAGAAPRRASARSGKG